MSNFELYCMTGGVYSDTPTQSYSFDELNLRNVTLPDGAENIRLVCYAINSILNLKSVKACAKTASGEDLWYDLSFKTDGFRLGHNLFLLNQERICIEGTDFRYHTVALQIEMEIVPLSAESTEKLAHETTRLQEEVETLDRKWKYQIEVYDEKVEEVVKLERDKVELNEAIDALRREKDEWKGKHDELIHSSSWKMTEPIRNLKAGMRELSPSSPLNQKKKAFQNRVKEVGEEQAKKELFSTGLEEDLKLMLRQRTQTNAYEGNERRTDFETERGLAERQILGADSTAPRSNQGIKFTLYTVLRNHSEAELVKFLHLVLQQTYPNYELLILDQNEEDHRQESKLLEWYGNLDSRIRIVKRTADDTLEDIWQEQVDAFIEKSTGDYVAWINVEDVLHPSALYECTRTLTEDTHYIYTDSAFFTENLRDITPEDTWYKPDYSPVFLEGQNYIRNLFFIKSDILKSEAKNYINEALSNGTSIETFLVDGRFGLTMQADDTTAHVRECLYYEKKKSLTPSEQRHEAELIQKLLEDRQDAAVEIVNEEKCLFHIKRELTEKPLISVMIPNKDHLSDLKRVIDSVHEKTTHPNYEIVVVENNSSQKETFDYYRELETSGVARVLQWKEAFNYAAINNWGEKKLRGEYVLLLNNDVEVITPNWMEELLQYASRPEVGAVGAKLYYLDDTIQHAGVMIGLGGVAAHSHKDYPRAAAGYMNRLLVAQNLSAVTAACILMRRSVYEEIGGMNEGYEVAFNDADFCMKIRQAGYQVIFTPFAELYHDESKSRGFENTVEKAERFESEVQRFKAEWPEVLRDGDPYYNPNLTSAKEDFDIREELKG